MRHSGARYRGYTCSLQTEKGADGEILVIDQNYNIVESGKDGPPALGFYIDEYRLNAQMKHFPKPLISLVHGFVMGGYEGHRGWINYLAVKPSQQRKGYGQAIMQAVEDLLRQKGCPKINLQVRSSNSAVVQFYSALGYDDNHVIGLGKRLEQDL